MTTSSNDHLHELMTIRSTRAPGQRYEDSDDPTLPQSDAWWRQRNYEHTRKLVPPRYDGATTDSPAIWAWVLGALSNPKDARSLLLCGPTGTGKTHAAYAAVLLTGESPHSTVRWIATSTATLYGDLRPSGKRDTEAAFNAVANSSLLLLDDLGSAKNSEWTEEITYRLIDHRYTHCLPSIFTTNIPTGELANRLGDRTASRLAEMCERVVLAGPDRRRPTQGA